jgi:peptide/nickel transport system substrate-binding protein
VTGVTTSPVDHAGNGASAPSALVGKPVADPHRKARRRLVRLAATVATAALTVVAVGVNAGASTTRATHRQGSGGNLNFGLEAETTDYCLSRAQLAISGIQVVAAVYDTLTVPNSKGVATPYLAKSVTPNANFTQWTIALRPGINFQDGTPFNAAAVKLNLDTYRGSPSGVSAAEGPLFTIYLGFVQDVSVVDPMTVSVTLKTPVADFPSYLYSTGRMGMMSPAQINGNCSTNMIGTGPFKLQSYQQNQKTVVVKNPNYWQAGYPKANSITFFPIDDESARTNQLEGGQLDLLHTSSALQLSTLKTQSQLKLLTQSPGYREIHYYWLISDKAPFNSQTARTAFAEAVNREELNTIRNKGLFQVANALQDKNAPGYLANAGYPAFNLKNAQTLVNQVKAANGGQFNITLGATTDPEASAEAQLLKEQLGKAGINATIAQFDQATLINKALQGSIDVLIWRNLHGEYSDFSDQSSYVWFANADQGYLTNFGRYNDPQTQALLDQGRAVTNPSQDKPVYQQLNKVMAAKGYLLPAWYVSWTIAYTPSVKLTFPPLPNGQGSPLFEYGRIPVLGLSKS